MIKIDDPQQLTKKILERLVGKHIHVKINTLYKSSGNQFNAWFAGKVVGIEETTMYTDPATLRYFYEPIIQYGILLTDGTVYKLSLTDLLIEEISESQFNKLLREETARREVNNQVIKWV